MIGINMPPYSFQFGIGKLGGAFKVSQEINHYYDADSKYKMDSYSNKWKSNTMYAAIDKNNPYAADSIGVVLDIKKGIILSGLALILIVMVMAVFRKKISL